MYRTAADFALNDYPVILINSSVLVRDVSFGKFEDYFKLIHHLHNASLEKDEIKPLLVFTDNPAARIEDISKLLSRFDDLEEEYFKCTFILFERAVRHRQAEEENFLTDIAASRSRKAFIETENISFKKNVFESFTRALELSTDEIDLAEKAFFENQYTTIAEAIINFCKKTKNEKYRKLVMDWIDFEDAVRRRQWNSLTDLYKLTSVLYQFGVAVPISLVKKIIKDFDQNEFYDLEEFFNTQNSENLPLILEGGTLRTRHELIAGWYVDEKLKVTLFSRLGDILKAVDVQDALERSIYIALLGRKNIVNRYVEKLDRKDFETILQNAAGQSLTQRLALIANGWICLFRNELELARDTFKSILEIDVDFLPAIMETAKTDFLLKNYSEAEQRLKRLLDKRPNDLHTRTELARFYRSQKNFDKTEKLLKECIDISPRDLNLRTELGKVYQALERYEDAEKILLESIEIDDSQLHPRTELARVYIITGLFRKSRTITVDVLQNKSANDNREIAHLFLTYLNACYQMKRYDEGISFIDKYACQFLSPQLAEEYGRLLRNYDLKNAVKFFQIAARIFKKSSRLLSEAAICLKLGGNAEAESILNEAIYLEPKKEWKYRKLYENARSFRPINFRHLDHQGIIVNINHKEMNGIIETNYKTYSFRWNSRLDLLYSKLNIGDEVYFDITNQNHAMNIEPVF